MLLAVATLSQTPDSMITGARRTELPPLPIFKLSVYIFIFNKNVFIPFLFHLFFLILTCSCPYSYNLMLTVTYMCWPYIILLLSTRQESSKV